MGALREHHSAVCFVGRPTARAYPADIVGEAQRAAIRITILRAYIYCRIHDDGDIYSGPATKLGVVDHRCDGPRAYANRLHGNLPSIVGAHSTRARLCP
jgi:hypothetical protein